MPNSPHSGRTRERSIVTIASTTARPRSMSRRREVTTTKQKLRRILRRALKPAPRHTTSFNGQLLDQKREDVYVVMHQTGPIR